MLGWLHGGMDGRTKIRKTKTISGNFTINFSPKSDHFTISIHFHSFTELLTSVFTSPDLTLSSDRGSVYVKKNNPFLLVAFIFFY